MTIDPNKLPAHVVEASARAWWDSISGGRASWSSRPLDVKALYREHARKALAAGIDKLTEDDERIARLFHECYERLAPEFGYITREDTRTPWPPPNADLMRAAVREALHRAFQGEENLP